MATREEIFVLLRSNDHMKVREGLRKAKLYDSELYGYCMRLFELINYTIKDFASVMDFQRGITAPLHNESLKVVQSENLEDINKFLGIELDIRSIQVNETQSIHQLRANYDNGKKPVESN